MSLYGKKRICSVMLAVIAAVILTAAVDDSPLIGKQAPDFTLSDYNGGGVSLSDMNGDVVMLVFWSPT